jgi:inositol-pentakisphosphate 2-kinase
MTLRDCTCFAQIPLSPDAKGPANVALCDFDWKDPERKLEHWRSREAQLINGGFYTAGRVLCEVHYYNPPTLCLLEHRAGEGANVGEVVHAVAEATSEAEEFLPKKTEDGKVYTHQTEIKVLLERLEKNEQGKEGSVTDPKSLKDPTR